ncbi:MAG: FAD:protein FMN transferase [Planctomycetota bacterium]
MSEPQSETSPLDKDLCGIANLRRFRHAAMAATFDIFIVHKDALYAEQAAQDAFNELDHIENNLSRFIENSDVSRINSLGPNCPLQLGPAAFECLQKSIGMYQKTNGAFDVTFDSSHKGSNLLKLNESEHTVELLADGVRIDLGAIGKGYAADKMGQILGDWGIDTALISAGQSTILPVGVPQGLKGWPLTLSDPTDYNRVLAKIHLKGLSLSASGLQKGPHIINPRSGKPAKGKLAAWATTKTASTGRLTAAAADALSTAFMVMPIGEIRAFCKANPDTSAFLILPPAKKGSVSRVLQFGSWK